MRLRPVLVVCFTLLLGFAGRSPGAELLTIDFEQGKSPQDYQRLDCRNMEAAIVPRGPDDRGHCLRLHNAVPAAGCSVLLRGPIVMEKNLTLSLDHREEIEPGFEGAYLGISFFVDGKQWFWTSDEFSGSWRHADIPLARLRSSEHVLRPGTVFSGIQIYGRVKEKTKVKGQTKARLTVWLDNVRLHTDPAPPKLAPLVRESYSNPPLLVWPLHPGARRQRLQYSPDKTFPGSASHTVDVSHNFFMPRGPLQPGTWYWRVWSEGELGDDWSEIQTVSISPEAHRFTTPSVPAERLARAARPRLLPLAKIGQSELTDRRKAELVKQAKRIFERGVPDHPGKHVPGDPRWPTWIDWYGKVAGGITGATGRRLQSIGQYAMLTGDPQVIGWTKQLALAACKWDPQGGSAMKFGDIGAHHLLRGLNWCYDACHDSMTASERETLRKAILERAGQFWSHLYPFRGSEANNHAWLQALGVAESGIVLLGEHDEAAVWAEYVRQLFLGRFLCCLGFQGDNNEGISYWGYGLGFVIDYADLMKAVCGINLFEHPWLSQTARFPMYCAPPNAWAVSFADTGMPNHGVRGPAQTGQVGQLAIRTRDPYALWYSGRREPVEGLVPRPPADLPQSIHYRHIGVAIFNTSLVDGREGATVALHSGHYWAGHQHPDQNHFVIHAYGEKLAIDGGYYDWYGSPHFRAYSMQTLAHNTLLVNGRGQADRKAGADGRIAAWFDSPGYGYTVGDASKPEIYHGLLKQFDRRVLFIKPGFVVIHDLVASAKGPAACDWLLHAIVPIQTETAKKSFSIVCQDAALRGRFFLPATLTMDVRTGFPAEPVDRYSTRPVPKDKYFPEWVIYATPKEPRNEDEFLVAMQIQRLKDKPEPAAPMDLVDSDTARAIRIRCAAQTHLAVFRKPWAKGPIRVAGLESDGEAAALELASDGTIVRAMAIGATSLSYQQNKLLQSDKTTNWSTPNHR